MCICPSIHKEVNTFIKIGNEIIEDQNTLKILGFLFGRKADISAQLGAISLKFRRRVWVLRHLKRAGVPQTDLVKLYQSLVLPVLDYTSVIYHSMLGRAQIQEVEKMQKLALKIIYGVVGVTYDELLDRSGLPTLATRRQKMVDKFIQKAAAHPVHGGGSQLDTLQDMNSERSWCTKKDKLRPPDYTIALCSISAAD